MAGRTAPSAPDTPDAAHGADRDATSAGLGSRTLSRPRAALAAAASQAPLGLALAALWSTAVRHPLAALALLLGYEGMVALAAFGGRVAGDLRDRWARRVADRIDRTARRHVSRFERQYRTEVVLSRNRFVDLKGLATRGDYTPGLEEVFVDVSLATHNLGRRAPAVLSELLELAPFGKVLYASDAFGLAEYYYLGALLFRRGLERILDEGVNEGAWTRSDAVRVARLIASENARRVYKLEASTAEPQEQ